MPFARMAKKEHHQTTKTTMIKRLILLAHIRREPHFFWTRIVIGTILALFVHFTGVVDPKLIIHETADKQALLVVIALILCIPVFIIHRLKPESKIVHFFHKNLVFFCQTMTIIIRSALVMGLSVLLYCMAIEQDPSVIISCITFLYGLEILTYVNGEWGEFNYKLNPAKSKSD